MAANLTEASKVRFDDVVMLQISSSDPERNVYQPDEALPQRCSPVGSRRNQQWPGVEGLLIKFPDSFVSPILRPDYRPNEHSVLLQPDKDSIVEIQPLARCSPGDAVFGFTAHRSSIHLSTDLGTTRGAGDFGAHGGSGLSTLGGTIRLGELQSSLPIRHALKILIPANRYLSYNASTQGFRFPALKSDDYANIATDPRRYGGTNPELRMGSLLALPVSINVNALGLRTSAALKIAQALQDYGGYVSDDAAENAFYLVAERGVADSLGVSDDGVTSGDLFDDINLIFRRLSIVSNNQATNPGGGGIPRRPSPPPFRN